MPASTAQSEKVQVSLFQHGDKFESRFVTGAWGLIPRPSPRTISAWKASGNGRDCSAGSAASEARRGKALG